MDCLPALADAARLTSSLPARGLHTSLGLPTGRQAKLTQAKFSAFKLSIFMLDKALNSADDIPNQIYDIFNLVQQLVLAGFALHGKYAMLQCRC